MISNRPRLVTVTGLDRHTDLGRAIELSARYPLEFAILCDPDREGRDTRVPEPDLAARLAQGFPSDRLAFHLCGAYSASALDGETEEIERRFPLVDAGRLQVNAPHYSEAGFDALRRLGARTGCAMIAQSTAAVIPFVDGLAFLDDQSAGRGKVPDARARPDPLHAEAGAGRMVGYAGGLSPENLAAELDVIALANPSTPYWIDVASGVRDTANRLDLDRVERFLAIAFGTD